MHAGRIVAEKYRLGPQIGSGGMGSVFDATHTSTGRRVALKIMRAPESGEEAERERIARFQREAVVVGQLETQHVVQVFDAGFDAATNELFIAMELLEGEDLSQLLKRIGPLRVDLAVAVVAQACAGLAKAHEAGVVHRDIKPGNLFLTRGEHGEHVLKVLDFGVAKVKRVGDAINAEGMTLTQTGALVGSPFYMSPEQARGRKSIDHRADVWSLGVVLHKLVAGRTPFDGVSTLGEVIIAICSEEPTSLRDHAPWAPPLVVEVVRRALRRDPRERFQTALEMLEALRPIVPNGLRITEDMIVGLPPELLAQLATLPRALDRSLSEAMGAPTSHLTPPPSSASFPLDAPPVSNWFPPGGSQTSSLRIDSAGELAATQLAAAPPRRRWGAIVALLAAFVGLAAIGGFLGVVALRRPALVRAPVTGDSVAPVSAVAPPSATELSAAPPQTATREGPTTPAPPTLSSAAPPTRVGAATARPKGQPTPAPPKTGTSAPGRLSGGVGGDVPF